MACCVGCLGAIIGTFVLLKALYSICNFFWVYFIRPGKNLKEYGDWAVVTGASDGIGKAYAEAFAAKGLNVILISRNANALQEVAKGIESAYNVQTKVVSLDLSGESTVILETIENAVMDLNVGILVNNAGVSYSYPELFGVLPTEQIESIVNLNTRAVTLVTKVVLPGMVTRGKGAIVNVSSGSAWLPLGLLTVYSATKAYVDFFSRALAQEYRSKGIHVQSVLPFMVSTKLSKVRPSVGSPTPKAYCAQAIKTIGYEERTAGYWVHHLQMAAMMVLPECLALKWAYGMHSSIRARALKKLERMAKAQ